MTEPHVYLDAIGTVTPVYTDTIVSRVAGMITQVHFKEGQIVKRNDLLAIIDPRPYVAVLEQAQGQLGRDHQAMLKNARIDLVRYQNSYKVHAIPEQLATQQATVDSDEATVKLDEGNLAAAQVNVDYTRITAPIAGRVGLRNIDPGHVVTANGTSGLCVITQIQPITVIFTIAEDEIDEVTAEMASGRTLQVLALDIRPAARSLLPDRSLGQHPQYHRCQSLLGTGERGDARQRPAQHSEHSGTGLLPAACRG
jgi:multidrug efflux system membrane fusion protein